MLMATLATIGASVAFRGQTQTRTTAQSQDSKTAFQAAEGILAQALSDVSAPADIINLSKNVAQTSGNGFSVIDSTTSSSVTDVIPKDGQYSIYMTSTYNSKTNTFGTDYFPFPSNKLTLYFDSENTCPVLELTAVIDGAKRTLKRDVTRKCGSHEVANTETSGLAVSTVTKSIDKISFLKSVEYSVPPKTLLLIVRSLFGATKIGVDQSIPSQSILVTATARTTSGSQKTIQVYQPYPQIPAEFFVTRF